MRQRANCPFCGCEVTAVIGQFVVNHWRHLAKENCDPWSEPETEWHLNWKSYFPENFREVIMRDEMNDEKHIADIKTDTGVVIEFQNSPITFSELTSRNEFYKKIIWVVNGNSINYENLKFYTFQSLLFKYNDRIGEFSFYGRSKIYHKWSQCPAPVFFDFGEEDLFWRKSFDKNKKGVFEKVSKQKFLAKYSKPLSYIKD